MAADAGNAGSTHPRRLYVDASSLIRIALGDDDAAALKARADQVVADGAALVSSPLLVLEVERMTVRLETLEHRDASALRAWLNPFEFYPLSEEVWRAAFEIRQHIKTLDAINVATCSFVPDSALLTSDVTMRRVAQSMGIAVL